MGRVLYFDIDGTLLDNEDRPKSALLGGRLQHTLMHAGFTKFVCVSGWSDLFASPVLRLSPEERKRAICKMLKEMLDGDFLEDQLRLAVETDNRCRSIDVNQDFYYIDDWADEYTIKQFGENFYNAHYGKRILRVDPYGDGTDILDWLESISLSVK